MNEYKNEYENYYGDIKKKYLGLTSEDDEFDYKENGYKDYLEVSNTDIVPKNKVSYSKYARAFAESNRIGNVDEDGYRRYDDRFDYNTRNSYDYRRTVPKKSNYFNVIMYELIGVAILVFAIFIVKTSPIKELNSLYKQGKEVVKITGTLNVENTPVFKNIQNAISDLDKKMKPIDVDTLPQKDDATNKVDEKKEDTTDVDSSDVSNL